MKEGKEFWDNFDDVLYQEFLRQRLISKFKKQRLAKQIMYN